MQSRLYHTASVAFVLFLSLPLLQTATGLLPSIGLGGVQKPVTPLEPSFASFHDGSLQAAIEGRVRRDLGLRDWMVRTDNELRLRVFGSCKRPVVANDDGWLLDDGYLPTKVLARDFDLVDDMLLRAHNLKRLQAVLATHDVHLAVCVSPSKTWVYPERVSSTHGEALHRMQGRYTYPEVFRAGLDEERVRHFDFGETFRQWRYADAEGTPPLFPRGGIHWSNHAAARAAVAMADAMEQAAQRDFRSLEIARVEMSPVPVGGEDDLVKLANLLDTTSWQEPIGQPVMQVRTDDQGEPMPTLLVGTSFLWAVARALAADGAAVPLSVWYYFKSETKFENGKQLASTKLDLTPEQLRLEVLRYKVVIVEGNESATIGFGQGFIEAALRAFGEEPATEVPKELMHRIEVRARATR